MSPFIRTMTCIGTLAAALAAVPAHAHALTHEDIYGESIPANQPVDRTVTIQPGERAVYVEHGDTVKFVLQTVSGEQSFSWRFDGVPDSDRIRLSELSPGAGSAGNVWVQVETESDSGE